MCPTTIDTGTAVGKALLGVFAEFENNLRRERQIERIAKATRIYKGRRPSIDTAKVRALKADGLGLAELARRLGIARASIYRALGMKSPSETTDGATSG